MSDLNRVLQSGNVTPRHSVIWTTDGVIQDGGPVSPDSGGPVVVPAGIVPDGKTDNTFVIQAAIDANQNTSGDGNARILLLPSGKIVTGPLTIAGEIILTAGGVAGTILLLKDGSTAPLITTHPSGSGPSQTRQARIAISNMSLSSQTPKTGSSAAHGIYMKQGAYRVQLVLNLISINDMPGMGIAADTGYQGNTLTVYTSSIVGNVGDGVNPGNSDNWHFFGGQIAVNNRNLVLAGAQECTFIQTNIFSAIAENMHLFDSAGQANGDHVFISCQFDRGGKEAIFYDMRGNAGAFFYGCTMWLASQSSVGVYPDVRITANANNLAVFTDCVWGGSNASDPTSWTELQALHFDTTTNYAMLNGSQRFAKDGILRTNQPTQVFTTAQALRTLSNIYGQSDTQFTGLVLANSTNTFFSVKGFSASNDSGVMALSTGGVAEVQLAGDRTLAINYIDGDLWMGNTDFNAIPSTRTVHATGGSGANVAGANLQLAGGRSTGTATGGPVAFLTSAPGSSGSSANVLVERARVRSAAVGGMQLDNATGGASWTSVTGVPTHVEPIGSLCSRTDGAPGSSFYISAGGGVWNAIG